MLRKTTSTGHARQIATRASDSMSVICFLMVVIACLRTTDASVRHNYDRTIEDALDDEDEQWSSSGLKESEQAIGRTVFHDDIRGIRKVVAPEKIIKFTKLYMSSQRSRDRSWELKPPHVTIAPRTSSPVPFCGTTTITLNTSWINWEGFFVNIHIGEFTKRRQVKDTIGMYRTFNLTICQGSCKGNGIQSKVHFKNSHSKILSRLHHKAAEKLQLRHKPCCVPSKYGKEDVLVVLNFNTKTNSIHYHEGRVKGLRNAVACECV